MTSFRPDNSLPEVYEYTELLGFLREANSHYVGVGPHTTASLRVNGRGVIEIPIRYYGTELVVLRPGGVQLNPPDNANHFTVTTADRMNRAVNILGYKVSVRPAHKSLVISDRDGETEVNEPTWLPNLVRGRN